MAEVLKIYLGLSLEMKDALKALTRDGAEGSAHRVGAAIAGPTWQIRVKKQTLEALARRELVTKVQRSTGTWLYTITKLGMNVGQ